jgi:hypothetical protein
VACCTRGHRPASRCAMKRPRICGAFFLIPSHHRPAARSRRCHPWRRSHHWALHAACLVAAPT